MDSSKSYENIMFEITQKFTDKKRPSKILKLILIFRKNLQKYLKRRLHNFKGLIIMSIYSKLQKRKI